jgi:hypothetical protein
MSRAGRIIGAQAAASVTGSSNHFPENPRNGDKAQRKDQCPDIGNGQQIHDRMHDPQPEE